MEAIEYNPFGKGGGGAPVKNFNLPENRQHSISNHKSTEAMQMRTFFDHSGRNSSFEKGRSVDQILAYE
jgi:hypothetical protein